MKKVKAIMKIMQWAVLAMVIFWSCKNDIETINALTSEIKIPDKTGYDVETIYHDSGWMNGKIVAAEINIYDRLDEPYSEFPQGLKVYMYDRDGHIESYIQAKYAIFYRKSELWEARNEVIAENLVSGEKLETDQLFWNQKEERIYSEKFTKITDADGIYFGEDGFEANEDLSQRELFGARGTIYVDEEQTLQ